MQNDPSHRFVRSAFEPHAPSLLDRFVAPHVTAGLLLALGAWHRLDDLSAMVNVDFYYLWTKRVARFVQALGDLNFAATYQSHHPGVLFMWLEGLWLGLAGRLDQALDPSTVALAALPIALLGVLFAPAAFLVTHRLLGPRHWLAAFLVGLIFASEPMLVAHARTAHLDLMVTAFSTMSLLTALLCLRTGSRRHALVTGLLLGLGLLTKLAAGGVALGIVLVFSIEILRGPGQRRRLLGSLCLIAAVSSAVVLLLWPALWVEPQVVVRQLLDGASGEIDKSGAFMFLGETGRLELPWSIYGFYTVFLLTPELVIPAMLGLGMLLLAPPRLRWFTGRALLVGLPFLVVVLTSARVGPRYLLPAVPLLVFIAAAVLETLATLLLRSVAEPRRRITVGLFLLSLAGFRLERLNLLHPLPITYCSQWTGVACTRVFHLGWGEGLRETAQAIGSRWARAGAPVTVYGGAYTKTMTPWLSLRATGEIADAELLVDYIADWQRLRPSSRAIARSVQERGVAMLEEVRVGSRAYARIYPGPRYRAGASR